MKRLLIGIILLMAVAPMDAEVAAVSREGEFFANIKPQVTDLNVEDYYYLATYFHSEPSGAPPFDWCWSQQVVGWVEEVKFNGNWVFCGRENWMMADPFNTLIGPEFYVVAGVIESDEGEIYTMTYRTAAWDGDTLEGFGGLTRFFGGTGEFNHALGWTTDRPRDYPPSSWTKTQGAISVLGAGMDDHPSTKIEFPARVPGNLEVPGDEDYFVFEIKAGWSFRIGTTLGTLDDSLVVINSHGGPPECQCQDPYCRGYWWEDDGWWDGEGSSLGPLTAPADCVYRVWVIDWGRDGINHAGTYTLWAEAYPPQQGSDFDNDGVDDAADACPATTIPESVPTVSFEYNRYALTDNDGIFDSIRDPGATGPGPTFTIEDTAGCSCEQIVEATGERPAQLKYGCTVKTMREWVAAVSP